MYKAGNRTCDVGSFLEVSRYKCKIGAKGGPTGALVFLPHRCLAKFFAGSLAWPLSPLSRETFLCACCAEASNLCVQGVQDLCNSLPSQRVENIKKWRDDVYHIKITFYCCPHIFLSKQSSKTADLVSRMDDEAEENTTNTCPCASRFRWSLRLLRVAQR